MIPLLAALLLSPEALAGRGAALGLAVVVPSDALQVRLVAGPQSDPAAVVFSDDGAFAMDIPGDGEWWAVLRPDPGTALAVEITGTIDEEPAWHREEIAVPDAWQADVYAVTLLARRENGRWHFDRVLSAPKPEGPPPGGSGVGRLASEAGIAPLAAYGLWGLLALGAVLISSLRTRRTS